jgi:hypothetical protein
MKPTEDIERFVRRGKPDVTTGRAMDKRVLDDSFDAMDKAISAGKPSAAGMILRSRAVRLAAAAVIIVAVGLLMVYRKPPVQPPPGIASAAKSPAEMLTAMSLNMAWRRGGIEAVDEQSSKAFEMLGSKPAKVSIQELLVELNGV